MTEKEKKEKKDWSWSILVVGLLVKKGWQNSTLKLMSPMSQSLLMLNKYLKDKKKVVHKFTNSTLSLKIETKNFHEAIILTLTRLVQHPWDIEESFGYFHPNWFQIFYYGRSLFSVWMKRSNCTHVQCEAGIGKSQKGQILSSASLAFKTSSQSLEMRYLSPNLKLSITHSLTHPLTGVGARRCYRI